jgi:hypothetical protein
VSVADGLGRVIGWGVALVLFLAGCGGRAPAAGVDRLYAIHRQEAGSDRVPVVVIPGIPAVGLQDGEGRLVWDPTAGARSAGSGPALALPMRIGAPLRDLGDQLRPLGIPGPRPVRDPRRAEAAGADLQAALALGGYSAEAMSGGGPPTLYRFDYDWRRDLVESAADLHRFLLDRRADLDAARRGGPADRVGPIRFDLVAQSTGGLLLRYFLRYGGADLPEDGSLPTLTWAGADLVGRAILIGPPNAGSISALLDLVGGEGGAILPPLPSVLLGTFPSAYQMLPRGRHGGVVRIRGDTRTSVEDPFDPALWESLGWGLASPDLDAALVRILPGEPEPIERRRIALDHLRKCLRRARRFCEALDIPARPPAGLSLHLVASDGTPTGAVAGIDWATGRARVIEWEAGDGVVPRTSALLDERVGGRWSAPLLSPIDWRSVTFHRAAGESLWGDPAFIDNLLFLLLEQPRP